jgi:hypothetical protein
MPKLSKFILLDDLSIFSHCNGILEQLLTIILQVQNADDNAYSSGVEAALFFLIQGGRIVVLNNEVGFTAANIRALCDVGSSTKAGVNTGYIGHKGIGFKSVFRVSWKDVVKCMKDYLPLIS